MSVHNVHVSRTVTGGANFAMESTALTVGGFNQPPVARTLIEQSGSAEIGLSRTAFPVVVPPAQLLTFSHS